MRMLKAISQTSPKGMEGGALARLEGRHRSIGGNALRAGVLGANDGLVSNLSLIMGVAGADLSGNSILVTGFAGLVAGACSMAMGEWLSVQSSRELYERQIKVEAQELAETPKEEEEELALIYEAKGLPKEEAEKLAKTLISDEKNALKTLAREELGIDPDELGGSAWEAALMSFVLFAAGAVIPLIPFFFLSGKTAVIASAGAGAAALFLTGALITLLTGRNLFFSGFRQTAIGMGAALTTYLIGRLVGNPIAG
jgi:VIT1/CCC1 family predicted Fe2+/Mn2+ transporter